MLDNFWNISTPNSSMGGYIVCVLASLVLGAVIGCIHMYRNNYSKNFILTLLILPAVVQAVILLVNGNLGTGVAVMGAFNLVRFRSVPGNSREIANIFLAMATGLATGTGYLGIAVLMVVLIGLAQILMVTLNFGNSKGSLRDLKITLPEDLEFDGIFDDLFAEYTTKHRLIKVKTANMGSLFEIHYQVALKSDESLKKFMDAIRCRNGNLPVVCNYVPEDKEEL
ncbi:MAG: DUF4956 domain-containing protein [Lachnospiraceae bacterium]|nr:DUF4956 domain-containing protein [Lachnospiraceae bacterium]